MKFSLFLSENIIVASTPQAMDDKRIAPEDNYYDAIDKVANGDLAGAVVAFRACLADDPSMLDAMHGLIRALKDLRELDEAVRVALRLAEIDPDDVLAHTSLSILYQNKGMVPEAEAEATKAKLLGWKLQLRQQKDDAGIASS
jgi:Flp pilus assembly protein TadD